MKTCPRCAVAFDPLSGGYAPDGSVVCATCAEQLKKAAADLVDKNKGTAFVGACGSVLIALASFIIQFRLMFFLMPLMAIAFGAGTAFAAFKNAEVKRALGWKAWPTVAIGTLGACLGVLSLLASFGSDDEPVEDQPTQTDSE